MTKTSKNRHHVVIIGAGFGGIEVANQLAGVEVDVTIIDRRNHHLFQPLLYQVAGASLSTSEIAWPIRYLFRNRPEVTIAHVPAGVRQHVDENKKLVRFPS